MLSALKEFRKEDPQISDLSQKLLTLDQASQAQINQLENSEPNRSERNQKIHEVKQTQNWQITQLIAEQIKTTPQAISQALIMNQQLHYLFSCETSLKNRAGENQQYEARLRISCEKYTRLEQKLEQIRDLLADEKLNKLMALYKKGEI